MNGPNPFHESEFPYQGELFAPPSAITPQIGISRYKRFLPIAQAFAGMSKSISTKVGAVVLGPGFEVRSSGWNGAPRKCDADVDERSDTRSSRLFWVVHAEANAIANAARSGTALKGCAMVVTHMPCMNCAKLVVQAGITDVFCPQPEVEFEEKWAEDFKATRQLFEECGVRLTHIATS